MAAIRTLEPHSVLHAMPIEIMFLIFSFLDQEDDVDTLLASSKHVDGTTEAGGRRTRRAGQAPTNCTVQ